MRSGREPGWVPPGFSSLTHRSAPGRIALVRDDLRGWYEAGGLGDPEGRLRESRSGDAARGGRGGIAVISSASSGPGGSGEPGRPGLSLVLKKYRRGGAMAGMLPDVFLGYGRMTAELEALERARSRSVPSARAAALILDPAGGPFWRGFLLTDEIAGSTTLDRALRAQASALELAMRAVRVVRALHDAGIVHQDLNLRNLLVRGEEVFVIDLDGATLPRVVTEAQRFENLSRLDRSYCKLFRGSGPLSSSDRRSLLRGYSQGDEKMHAALEARIASHLRHLAWHRLLWRRTRR